MASQSQSTVQLTELAKKFGVPDPTKFPTLSSLGRSALTPTLPRSIIPADGLSARAPSQIPNAPVTNRDKTLEAMQRAVFYKGFSARELVDIGAWPDLNAVPSTLTEYIEDIINIDQWESPQRLIPYRTTLIPIMATGPEYSLGNSPGTWHAENPVIWKILKPVLLLASRFLANLETNIFIDALLCGDYQKLPREKWTKKNPTDKSRYSLTARKSTDRDPAEVRKIFEGIYKALKMKYKFQIGFGHESAPARPNKQEAHNYNGYTWSKVDKIRGKESKSIFITLNIDRYKPLLRNDMNVSERQAEEFFCAKTIIHELVHAMFKALSSTPDTPSHYNGKEPFFENDIFSEAGFAVEVSIFGGGTTSYITSSRFEHSDKRKDHPHLGFYNNSYPLSKRFKVSKNQDILDDAELPREDTFRPIPAHYYESIQQEEFWDLMVKKYGVEVVKPYCPVHTVGYLTKGSSKINFDGPILNPDLPEWVQFVPEDVKNTKDGELNNLVLTTFAMLKTDKADFATKLQAKLDAKRTQQRTKFRNGLSGFAKEVRSLWQTIDSSWEFDTEQNTISKLNNLVVVLEEEAMKHSSEIAGFVIRDDKDVNHRAFLEELNHHMRRMAKKFQRDTLRIQTKGNIHQVADMIVERLDTCLVMLNEQNVKRTMSNLDFYMETKQKMTPAIVNALVAASLYRRMDINERATLLQQGYVAVLNKDQPTCDNIGERFLDDYSEVPFFSAVAKVMLAESTKPQHKGIIDRLDHDERASLETANQDCTETERKLWRAQWKTKAYEAYRKRKNEVDAAVPCADHDETDDEECSANEHKEFMKKFRHDP